MIGLVSLLSRLSVYFPFDKASLLTIAGCLPSIPCRLRNPVTQPLHKLLQFLLNEILIVGAGLGPTSDTCLLHPLAETVLTKTGFTC